MKARTRDFIHTTDDLYFATTNYVHPDDRILSFLRYIPDKKGDREKDGKNYSKVDSKQAYEYLRENHPEYLYYCYTTNSEMMGVPHDKVNKIIKPNDRLKSLMENEKFIKNEKTHELLGKVINLAIIFHNEAGISFDDMGISGSTLPGLEKNNQSDIDFVIYGLENHRNAIETFKRLKDKDVIDVNKWKNPFLVDDKDPEDKFINKDIYLASINEEFWETVYEKRLKDSSLSLDEFKWYENRKSNRGLINNTLFDILATRNWNEINESWGDISYEPLGESKIECKINDALSAFDNPATYKITDVKVLEGDNFDFKEVASFTHTYAGELIEGEYAVARGKVEKVTIKPETSLNNQKNKKEYYRIVVGTTRESINEYIKLKNSPI